MIKTIDPIQVEKNYKQLLQFIEEYQDLAIDSELSLIAYNECWWWQFKKKKQCMQDYMKFNQAKVDLFMKLVYKIKPSKLDEILNN